MVIGVTYMGPVGLPTDLGFSGIERVRITLDGSLATVNITPPTTLNIKTLLGASCQNDIPTAGRPVDGSTATALSFAAGTNLQFIDVFLYGRGR